MIPAVFLLGLPPSSTLLNCSQTYTMSFLIPLRNRYSKISNSSFLKLQIGHMIQLKDSSIGVRNAKGNGPDSPLWVQEVLTSDSRLWRQEQPLFAPSPNSVFWIHFFRYFYWWGSDPLVLPAESEFCCSKITGWYALVHNDFTWKEENFMTKLECFSASAV